MTIYFRVPSFAILTLIIFTGCGVGEDSGEIESTTLTGIITSDSVPLNGVEVILTDGELGKKGTTNTEGEFQFDDVPEGI